MLLALDFNLLASNVTGVFVLYLDLFGDPWIANAAGAVDRKQIGVAHIGPAQQIGQGMLALNRLAEDRDGLLGSQ